MEGGRSQGSEMHWNYQRCWLACAINSYFSQRKNRARHNFSGPPRGLLSSYELPTSHLTRVCQLGFFGGNSWHPANPEERRTKNKKRSTNERKSERRRREREGGRGVCGIMRPESYFIGTRAGRQRLAGVVSAII